MMNGSDRSLTTGFTNDDDHAEDQRDQQQRQDLVLTSAERLVGAVEADAVEEPGRDGERDGVGAAAR